MESSMLKVGFGDQKHIAAHVSLWWETKLSVYFKLEGTTVLTAVVIHSPTILSSPFTAAEALKRLSLGLIKRRNASQH